MAQLDQKKIEEIKQTHFTLLAESLAAMRTSEKSDITLMCGDKQFFAHRCILGAASPYFKTVLSCGLQEFMSRTITFNSMEPETLEAILEFIYMGKVGHINTEEMLKSVLIASHLLQLEELDKYCGQALALLVSSNNFFELLEIGLKLEQEDLQKVLVSFWVVNSSKLFDTDKFLALEISVLKSLLNFIKCKSQCLDQMLNGFLNWLQYDLTSREKFIDEFFDCVDANLVKQQFVQSWLNDTSVVSLSKTLAKSVDKLCIAVVKSGSKPPAESVLLDVCSWKTRLTYFSQFRNIEVFNPSQNCLTAPRSEPMFCIQQLDLLTMKWLSLQIPKSANVFDFKYTYQVGDVIFMISESHIGTYEVLTNWLMTKNLKETLVGSDKFVAFNGEVYSNCGNAVFQLNLGSCEWKKASTLTFSSTNCSLLASTEYLYVIGDNPESSDELLVQYNSNPSDECSIWEVIRTVKGGLKPSDFFVYNNSLQAVIGFIQNNQNTLPVYTPWHSNKHTMHRSKSMWSEPPPSFSLQKLTYNHSPKKMEVTTHVLPQAVPHNTLKLSGFQDCRCPYIFFAENNDNLSIPGYAWQPASGVWTKLPPSKGKCDIPNDPSVKLVYSTDK